MSYTIFGQLVSVKRLTNSVNGNPRFKLRIYKMDETIELNTATDASIGYAVTNYKLGDWLTFTIKGVKQKTIIGITKGGEV